MDASTKPVFYPVSINAVLLIVFSAIVIVMNYVPLVALFRAKNIGACTMVAVLITVNFFTMINAIIWSNNDTQSWWNGAGLCDIEVLIRSTCNTLIGSSTCAMTRNLAQAMDLDNPRLFETRAMRRRRIFVDLAICFTIPVIQLAFHYCIQQSRYYIITIYGCADDTVESWQTILLNIIWPPIFALAMGWYAYQVIRRLRKHHGQLSNTLSSSGSGYNARRFMKLFIMALCLCFVYLPVNMYWFYNNLPVPPEPYSWSEVHNPTTWSTILFVTTDLSPDPQYYNWPAIGMGYFVILFYGLNNEAIDIYKGWLIKCGLGKIFPSLLKPREVSRRGSTSRFSWSSNFDVVGKAVHFFDGHRKSSQDTRFETRSRQPSTMDQLPLHHIPSSTTSDSLFKSQPSPISNSTFSGSTTYDHDAITTLPTIYDQSPQPARTPMIQPPRSPFLGTWRTHINLPFPLFPAARRAKAEFDARPPPGEPAFYIPPARSSPGQSTTVHTKIWGGHSHHASASVSESEKMMEGESEIDPSIPKMGTRAYREYARRELEVLEKADLLRERAEKGALGGVVGDEVVVEGVKVVRRLSMTSEGVGEPQ